MNWEAKLISHRGEKRIADYFKRKVDLIERIKSVEVSRWSQTFKVWHVPNTFENQIRFKINLNLPSPEGIQEKTK